MIKKIFIIVGVFVFTSVVFAGENLLKNANFANGLASWGAGKYPRYIKDGKFIANIPKNCGRWSILLFQHLKLVPGKYRLSYTLECQKNGIMRQVYKLSQKPYSSLGLSRNLDAVQGKKNYNIIFFAKEKKPGAPKLFIFNLSGLHGRIMLSNLKLEKLPILPLAINKSWTVFSKVKSPDKFNIIPQTMRNLKGNMVKALKVSLKNNSIDLAALNGGNFNVESSIAVLYNEFECSKNGTMLLGVSADWWMEVYVNGKNVYSTWTSGNGTLKYQLNDHVFCFPVKAGRNVLAVKVRAGREGWKFVCGKTTRKPEPARPNIKFTANDKWIPVKMADTFIKAGSALDLSAIVAAPLSFPLRNKSTGQLSRLIISPTGKLVAEGHPNNPVRLRGYSFSYVNQWGSKKDNGLKAKIDELCLRSSRQGYNLFRIFVMDRLCPDKDMSINAAYMNKVDYLIASMKKHGIYGYFVIMDNGIYHKRSSVEFQRLRRSHRQDHKTRMLLGDPLLRKAWKYGVDTILNHVNPYTGLTWKDDPVIVCLEFYNEQELGLLTGSDLPDKTIAEFSKQFRTWLKAKYKTPQVLSKAWGDKKITSFKQIMVPKRVLIAIKRNPSATQSKDLTLFCNHLLYKCAQWCEKTLRSTGYQGLSSQYDLPCWLGVSHARYENSQVAVVHKYFNHPSNQSCPGSRCRQNSSVRSAANYWRVANASRFADRPFFVTEYNHAFWNPFQHELGLVFSAYSALQGFDALVVHQDAAALKHRANFAWSISCSPVALASEFLTACIYLRGDVKSSPHRIELQIPEADISEFKNVSTKQDLLGLMTGFSVSFPWSKTPAGVGIPAKPDMTIMSSGMSKIVNNTGWSVDTIEVGKSIFSIYKTVLDMRKNGILPAGNISNPKKGIFQSDTGEITLRSREKLMKVVSAKTEAVTLKQGKREKLDAFTVLNSNADALVAVCAMDGKALEHSQRIVLLYSTEVVNTNLELSGDRITLINIGKLPVLLKVGKLQATLKNSTQGLSLYALGFNGERREKLPLTSENGLLKINIDTASLKDGPTSFFELSISN